MKIAIITLTPQGKGLAWKLVQILENDQTVIQVDHYHKEVKETLRKIFHEYDCILGIMATGIMVRSICNLIRDKTTDPSILIMDEKATHVISLLSGHLGGGNEFTMKIARVMGAEPVITTATDVNGKMGIDTLARKYFMELDEPEKIVLINKALVEGEAVELGVPPQLEYLFDDEFVEKTYQKVPSTDNLVASDGTEVVLYPKKLVVGIGARRGISQDAVLNAVNQACSELEIPVGRIDVMATAEPKKNETGILEVVEKLQLKLEVVSLDELKKFNHPEIQESPFVMKTFGVPGICEPTALYVAGASSRLVYRKKSFDKVTVAVAVSCLGRSGTNFF